MTCHCNHCRTPREVKQYDGQLQCTFCGHLFNDKPDTSPPDPQERKDKQRQEQEQYRSACQNEEKDDE